MIVKVADLIGAAQKALSDYDAKSERYDEAQKRWHVADTKGKHARALKHQRAVRDALTAGLKKGQPLDHATLSALVKPEGRYSYDNLNNLAFVPVKEGDFPRRFSLDGKTWEPPHGIPRSDLESLIALLTAVEEETISDGQLQRLGFKNLGWVFRAAVSNVSA